MGKNKTLYLITFGTLVLNFILMLCKTVSFDMGGFSGGNFSIVGFCGKMAKFLSNFGGQTNDGPIYQALKFLSIAGIILIAVSAVLMALPLLTGSKPGSLKLAKISVIYSFVISAVFFLLVIGAYSGQSGVDAGLTFGGVLYILESIVMIAAVFILSKKLKTADKIGF